MTMAIKKIVLALVVLWFAVGGVGHFVAPDFFMKIVPPSLPYRLEAVYVSGFFELLGAAGLLVAALRRAAGLGLIALTVAVTPANVYMWANPDLFPAIPEVLLALRLVLQAALIAAIWWSTQRPGHRR
ncbi:Uncharacterized membrane protein [Noviherbaspirillum suwonense]|jgi:uncharacterized membrane protein|uniref:Uncharacterized membrane protein n=2 Tax=Noviherbaspirillum suwonense TaxID=1224511 RepID=A0ABY1PY17_9BURK|nr:Uncharacterized membrane protein [Noviherbaspirillum suwonense]